MELASLRTLAGRVSPRQRTWQAILDSCDLVPEELPRPFTPIGARDFLICGPPRTGTALLTALLFQPPRAVTVMEPWDAMRLPPAELLRSVREELATGSLRRGRLDVEALRADGSVRWVRDGQQANEARVDEDTHVGVKLPAFWRYLDLLPESRFLVCLRHPVEVISSFRRTGGRLAEGLEYDTGFHRPFNAELLAATDDPAERRVLLFDRIAERILPHLEGENRLVVRYERWFQDPGDLMEEIRAFLGLPTPLSLPARIQPRPPQPPSAQEWAFVAERCRTIEALGYERRRPTDVP